MMPRLFNVASALRVEDTSARMPMEYILKQTTSTGVCKDCLPPGALVDKLATQESKLAKRGVSVALDMDLHKHVSH